MMRVKALMTSLAIVTLAGCATGSQGLREGDLRNENYYRGERFISAMTFPKLQQALFKHEAACGKAPIFKMDERQTGYATLWLHDENSTDLRDSIMVDLTALQSGMMAGERVKAQTYSYYNTSEAKRRVSTIWAAIEKPGVCGDAAAS
jgi:hypothetical protein